MVEFLILLFLIFVIVNYITNDKLLKKIILYFNILLTKLGFIDKNEANNEDNKDNKDNKENKENKENNENKDNNENNNENNNEDNNENKNINNNVVSLNNSHKENNIIKEIIKKLKKYKNNINLPINISLSYTCNNIDEEHIKNFLNDLLKLSKTKFMTPINYCLNNYDYSNIYEIKNFLINTDLVINKKKRNCDITVKMIFIPSKDSNIFIHKNKFNKLYGLFKIDKIKLVKLNEVKDNKEIKKDNFKDNFKNNFKIDYNNNNINNKNNNNIDLSKSVSNVILKESDIYESDSNLITTNSIYSHDIALV